LGAISGEPCCTLAVEPSWTVHRLKQEIAASDGTPTLDQHLLVNVASREAPCRLEDSQQLAWVLALPPDDQRQDVVPTVFILRTATVPRDPAPRFLAHSTSEGCSRISWCIEATKVRSNIKQYVSPSFDLDFGSKYGKVPFKMMIYAKLGASFRQTRGKGQIQLKCDKELPEEISRAKISISIGDGTRFQATRGPYEHDYSHSSVWRRSYQFTVNALASSEVEEFDFWEARDRETDTFLIFTQVEHGCS